MKWVTPRGVKLDRAACAWLITNHIDPQAQISFVEPNQVDAAVQGGATAFHNTTSEEGSTSERTSFQKLLAEHNLQSNEALALMGDVVRGAETKEPGSIEEAEGLRAIAKGTNALVGSDQEMIDRMAPIFDALYAYCSRRVAGQRGWASSEASWGAATASR